MKIAMMSAWNSDSGVSVHAELIGREWVKMGHRLQVFSFYPSDFHGTTLVGEDEDYVTRCFTTSTSSHRTLDPRPILAADYEVFVVQDLGMLPKDELAKIFHHIRRRATTLTVIHDSGPSSDPSFYQFDWDQIVCFDERYEAFLQRVHPAERISIIPFPCHPLQRGDQYEARSKLGLPQGKKILLIFGQRIKEHLPLLPLLREMNGSDSLLLLVVSKKDLEPLGGIEGIDVEIRKESPTIEVLYDYLHASDVLILHREPCDGVVVSSAAYQCLGSGCPILARDSAFFETLKDVVVTYSDERQFREALADLLRRGQRYQATQKALEGFLRRHSAEVVARQYIDLFRSLREERKRFVFQPFSGFVGATGLVSAGEQRGKPLAPSLGRM